MQTVFIHDSPTAVAVNTGEKKKSVYLLRVRTRLVVILRLPQYSGGWLSGSGRRRACSVNDMLTTLGWPSLKHRRSKARLVNFHEFHHEFITIGAKVLPLAGEPAMPTLSLIPSTQMSHPPPPPPPNTITDCNDLTEDVASALSGLFDHVFQNSCPKIRPIPHR